MLFCFITALKPAPAFKGKVLVKWIELLRLLDTCRHLHQQVDEIGRSSLLKKTHHFFLRAVRCHLVSYFRVYPKITYQLPSLWHSRLSPHVMLWTQMDAPFGRSTKTAAFIVV